MKLQLIKFIVYFYCWKYSKRESTLKKKSNNLSVLLCYTQKNCRQSVFFDPMFLFLKGLATRKDNVAKIVQCHIFFFSYIDFWKKKN